MTTVTRTYTSRSGGHDHRCAQGFCTVCGSVWPCWRALSPVRSVVDTAGLLAVSAPLTVPSPGLPRC